MKKRVYILRHGNAENQNAHNDAARRLTTLGEQEIASTARQFVEYQESLECVFVSPYERAQKTASCFAKILKKSGSESNKVTIGKLETLESITPYGRAMEITTWLSQQKAESILLITHQPFASELIELLCDVPLPDHFLMKTGTLVALEGEFLASACCSLRWILHPTR